MDIDCLRDISLRICQFYVILKLDKELFVKNSINSVYQCIPGDESQQNITKSFSRRATNVRGISVKIFGHGIKLCFRANINNQ